MGAVVVGIVPRNHESSTFVSGGRQSQRLTRRRLLLELPLGVTGAVHAGPRLAVRHILPLSANDERPAAAKADGRRPVDEPSAYPDVDPLALVTSGRRLRKRRLNGCRRGGLRLDQRRALERRLAIAGRLYRLAFIRGPPARARSFSGRRPRRPGLPSQSSRSSCPPHAPHQASRSSRPDPPATSRPGSIATNRRCRSGR
jgi:hypothetical protein